MNCMRKPNQVWIKTPYRLVRSCIQLTIQIFGKMLSRNGASQMGEGERAARIYGNPSALSNRVHPLFTDTPTGGVLSAKSPSSAPMPSSATVVAGDDIETYCHVGDEVVEPNHPVIFVWTLTLASLMLWLGIKLIQMMTSMWLWSWKWRSPRKSLPSTSWNWNESEGGKPFDALFDPNMGRSPSGTDRETTWQDAFDKAGLVCDLADDSDVGRAQLNVYLRPDPDTRRPRIHWDRSAARRFIK